MLEVILQGGPDQLYTVPPTPKETLICAVVCSILKWLKISVFGLFRDNQIIRYHQVHFDVIAYFMRELDSGQPDTSYVHFLNFLIEPEDVSPSHIRKNT